MNAVEMTRMSSAPMPMMIPAVWNAAYAVLVFFMWWVMMAAMMLPSAAPMLLVHERLVRAKGAQARPVAATSLFAAGYLVSWGAFSLVATALQWSLQDAGLLSVGMATLNVWLAAAILVAAGLWQLTPVKQVCLRHCQSPLGFMMHAWQPGLPGAFKMGVHHGSYCLGCCWFLMGLLFFGGVMNLYWIVGLAVFVLAEKLIPRRYRVSQLAGVGLVAWGAYLIVMQ